MAEPPPTAAQSCPVVEAVPIRRCASDLCAQLTRTIEPLRRSAQDAEIGLSFRCSKGVPASLNVDGNKLAWVVKTLVENALRYVRRGTRIRPGGIVDVNIGLADGDTSRLRIEISTDGLIPESAAGALSGAPTRADEMTLALVREIVEAHSGSIDVRTSRDERDDDELFTRIAVVVPLAPKGR